MVKQSQQQNDVKSSQLENGNFVSISINPVYNQESNPIILSLYNNQTYTGKFIIIPPGSLTPITQKINYNFNATNVLLWHISEVNPNNDNFIFNAREQIIYN